MEVPALRCVRCGAALSGTAGTCARCGLAAWAQPGAVPWQEQDGAAPRAAYHVSAGGGVPVGPEPYLPAERLGERLVRAGREPEARWATGASQGTRARHRIPLGGALLVVAIAALAGGGGGVLLRAASAATQSRPVLTAVPRPTMPARECLSPATDTTASQVLGEATLTTGLRDPAIRDFRPVDQVTSFTAGQQAYVTMRVQTSLAGTAHLSLCTPGRELTADLVIPPHSDGAYAHFEAALTDADRGSCVAVISWNGSVAAALPFLTGPLPVRP